MPIEVKAYRCSFCGRVYLTKKGCSGHEPICFRNPITRCCPTCGWFDGVWCKHEKRNYLTDHLEWVRSWTPQDGEPPKSKFFASYCRGWKPKEKGDD